MARFEIDFLTDYGDESLLAELRRIAAVLPEGQPLTKTAFGRHRPRVSASTIHHRFGGWKEALEKAGLGHLYAGQTVSEKMRTQSAAKLTNDDLIAELKRVHKLLGKDWLTTADFNAHSVTSEDAIRIRFGTFRKGLEAAGIPHAPYKLRRFSDQECFENIADVWTHYGCPPEYRQMFLPPSKIRGKTYVERWGTWRKSLKAFVDWTNAEDAPANAELVEPAIDSEYKILIAPKRTEADCREVRPGLRFKVFMRDHFRCRVCRRSPATHPDIVLHADHWDPVANGGKTTIDNLVTLCRECNLAKGKTVPTELAPL
jgi:hypothetical protein